MLNTQNKIWNATLYLRLSRDDGDKEESNSITGQRELLRDYISQRPEFREYAVRVDDGFSGSTFERPSFQKMIEDVKAGRTDCIIVKDLSRFGRNYLDAGEYIEIINAYNELAIPRDKACVKKFIKENDLEYEPVKIYNIFKEAVTWNII